MEEIKVTKSALNKILSIRGKVKKKNYFLDQIIYLTRQKMSDNHSKILRSLPETQQIERSQEFIETSNFWDKNKVETFISAKNELIKLRRLSIPEGRRDIYDEKEVIVKTNKTLVEIMLWFNLFSKN